MVGLWHINAIQWQHQLWRLPMPSCHLWRMCHWRISSMSQKDSLGCRQTPKKCSLDIFDDDYSDSESWKLLIAGLVWWFVILRAPQDLVLELVDFRSLWSIGRCPNSQSNFELVENSGDFTLLVRTHTHVYIYIYTYVYIIYHTQRIQCMQILPTFGNVSDFCLHSHL